MKFSSKINRDLIVLGIGALVIMTSSAFLYAELTRKIKAEGLQKIGSITFKREVAQRKYTSQVIWEDLEQNAPVYNFDTIRTADLSEARINLNGTSINMDENSMILLSMTGEGVNIDFSHGSISANRGDVPEGSSAMVSIKSSDAVVSIDKGDVKLSKTDEKGMDVTVTSGKADITTGTEKKTIEKDQRAVITGDSETKVFKLSLKLQSPALNALIASNERFVPVEFSWEAASGAAAVNLEIARDSKFTKGLITRPTVKNTITEKLEEGAYYWRIRAAGAAAGTVDYSDVWKLTIIKDEPVRLSSPQNGETITYSLKPPIINFRWQENSIASEYIVEVSKDAAFKTIVQSLSTQLKDIAMDTLGAGSYYWRVRTKNINFPTYGGVSPSYQIHVEKVAAVNPPTLFSPPDTGRVSAAMFGPDKTYIFSWSANSQVKEYDFIISGDGDFKSAAFSTRIADNFYPFRSPLPAGTYYWRVGAVTGAQQEVFSNTNTLTVIPADTIKLDDPVILDVRDAGKDEKQAEMRFAWSGINYRGNYRFEISGDKGFLNIKESITTRDISVTLRSVRAGEYYWRVRFFDNDRNQIADSGEKPLFISTDMAIVARIEDIEKPRVDIVKTEEAKRDTAQKDQGADIKQDLAEKEKEAARKEGEELARKKEEAAKRQQEEIAKKQREELARKKQEELARIKREAAERKEREALAARKKKESAPVKKEQAKIEYKEKSPGNRVKWKVALASSVMSQPVAGDNVIIITTRNGFLIGLNQKGRQLWRTNLGGLIRSTPALDKATVYIATVKGQLLAIGTGTGAVRWSKSINGPLLYGSAPVIENDRVFVATSYGVVHAFSKTGEELWKKNLDEGIFSPICLDKGVLYIGTERSNIYAIDAARGDVKWTYNTDGRIFSSSPKIHGGTLFVGCYSGTFYALDPSRGNLLWKFNAEKPILSSPVFFNDIVYFGTEGGIFYALNTNSGKKVWEFNTNGGIVMGSDVSNNSVLIPSGNMIFSVDVNSGELNWKQGFASHINTPVSIEGGNVFVGLESGEVVSLRAF